MGRIILTIPAAWSKPPTLETRLDLDWGPPVPALVDEFADLGARAGGIDKPTLRALRGHTGVLTAQAEFTDPGGHAWARDAARLMAQVLEAGALGVYVETGVKVFTPGAFEGLDLRDKVSLFHLFVEVLGDASEVVSEGMQAFDLPDVQVRYRAEDRGAAQAAAFGLAARMVCDDFRPVEGGVYRNSESAPLFRVHRAPPDGDPSEDPFVNPRGAWLLER